LFEENIRSVGVRSVRGAPWDNAASPNMGNVRHVVAAFNPARGITPADVPGHSQQFLGASGSLRSYQAMVDAAKALAMTGADVLADPGLVEKVRAEFRRET